MFSPVLALMLAAGAGNPSVQPTAAAEPQKGERKVCQVIEQIGSRLGNRRVCMTAREWEDKRAEERSTTERAQQNVEQPAGQ